MGQKRSNRYTSCKKTYRKMKELLEFIIKNILGESAEFEVSQEEDGSIITLTVKTSDKDGGLVIGKGGKTITVPRSLRLCAASSARTRGTVAGCRP